MGKNTLFSADFSSKMPLAYRLRPKNLDEYVGQEEVVGENGILRNLIKNRKTVNSIFFGPPGTGKTSLAEVLSNELDAYFEKLNATTSSVADIKEVVEKAERRIGNESKQTVLFLDEIHRFNKLQQDSLLPHTENGTVILIGATTENPYYSLNNSLLSRCIVFEFKKLKNLEIEKVIKNGFKFLNREYDKNLTELIIKNSFGDARKSLNLLEILIDIPEKNREKAINEINKNKSSNYYNENEKYNIISAMIKSIRGSDPDAAIYWMARLIDGGESPLYIARRLVISSAEDIGIANPDAIVVATAALNAVKEIGMPEARIILAEALIYLAVSTKSNSCYMAVNAALEDIKNGNIQEVPEYLKDSAKGYIYPHNFEQNFVKQAYMSEKKRYYEAGNNRNELLVQEKLNKLWR